MFAKVTHSVDDDHADNVMEPESEDPKLKREALIRFLRRGIHNLSEGYTSLDASRPWLVYWIVHAMRLLGNELTEDLKFNEGFLIKLLEFFRR